MEDEYDFHRARSIPERISPAEELRPYSQDDGLARVELLGDTRFGERRNGSVRAATMQQMQHVVGNHSLQRYVQRQHAQGGSAPVVKGAGSDVPEWLMKQVVDTGIARPEITKEYNKAVGALFEKWNTMDETQKRSKNTNSAQADEASVG